MARYFFEIAYHGGRYHGWQSQNNATGIQAVVEEALTKLFREPIAITGSGRTDTGVHCIRQYFHADIEKSFEPSSLSARLNSLLPRDIAIGTIRETVADASARYDARLRTYEYVITRQKDPIRQGLSYYYRKPLDMPTLHKASALLKGRHDFECFSKVKTDVDNFVCDVKKSQWEQEEHLLLYTISANRFLRGMVRAVVGTLLDVGSGKISMDEFKAILSSGDRRKAGQNVPPEGLFLVDVTYRRGIFV